MTDLAWECLDCGKTTTNEQAAEGLTFIKTWEEKNGYAFPKLENPRCPRCGSTNVRKY
jgi:DNA-directed RNA polymerase subunit RPC12/RpoP